MATKKRKARNLLDRQIVTVVHKYLVDSSMSIICYNILNDKWLHTAALLYQCTTNDRTSGHTVPTFIYHGFKWHCVSPVFIFRVTPLYTTDTESKTPG